ncbi:unnamed protein product [Amoebophrya sp. A25]|nr:unnamed protein product [Amoebophrya sp. A25]|eukprot:GSA25T00001381001.1
MPKKDKEKNLSAKAKARLAAKKEAAADGDASKAGQGQQSSRSAARRKFDKPNTERLTSDELGFVIRTGPDAIHRSKATLEIDAREIIMHAGKQELLDGALLRCSYGVKYGLIGRNGVGKSTLLRAISDRDGRVEIPAHMSLMHVEQEITGSETTVIQTVLESHAEREYLLELEKRFLEDSEIDLIYGVTLMEVYERLEELNSEEAETHAARILAGLGFTHKKQNTPTKEFSGGWRMRIALASALFNEPDLLLLDEPTNHLDVHAVTWLEEFLQEWERTVIIVSHDRSFLNAVTQNTIFQKRKKLWYYGGNYDTFLRVRAEHRANQEVVAKQQERKKAHLKQFIARFGRGHKKMARQAQSRMKLLAKLQEETVGLDMDDPYLKLDFPAANELPPPCISVQNAAFKYPGGDRELYRGLNFGVDMDSRVAIVGPNGAGKSTFLKLLDGTLEPTDGAVSRHPKLIIARFTQHHLEMMDAEEDSVTHMRRLGNLQEDGTSDVSIEEARKYLGRFGLVGELPLNPIKTLSGGQKSRLAFAGLAWRQPHLLLLDEPTNHLDLETIEGLAMALNEFEGGVVLVSHDERLLSMVSDEIWVVMPGETEQDVGGVTVFDGSFDEYRRMLRDEMAGKSLLKAAGGGRIKAKKG